MGVYLIFILVLVSGLVFGQNNQAKVNPTGFGKLQLGMDIRDLTSDTIELSDLHMDSLRVDDLLTIHDISLNFHNGKLWRITIGEDLYDFLKKKYGECDLVDGLKPDNADWITSNGTKLCTYNHKTILYEKYNNDLIPNINSSIRVQEHYNKLNPSWLQHSPGYELRLYSRDYYGGMALNVFGTFLILEGINTTDSSSKSIITDGGVIFSVIGTYLMIKSSVHIKRCGIIMDRNGVGIRIPISK